eukprot:gene4273-7609_t
MRIEEGVFIVSPQEDSNQLDKEEYQDVLNEDELSFEKIEEIKFYLNSPSDCGIWSYYKILDLFSGEDQKFDSKLITEQMIEKNSKFLLKRTKGIHSDLNSFIFKIERELKLNKNKYDQKENKKLIKQKFEITRISQIINNFENLNLFSLKNHLNLRFFNFQILGFVTNLNNFNFRKIKKEDYFRETKKLFLTFKVVIVILIIHFIR